MSVDYLLFRAPNNRDLSDAGNLLLFGSQADIIERLSAVVGFELLGQENLPNVGHLATIAYTYHNESDEGRGVEFVLMNDPVSSISIDRAYQEDFLPITNILSDLGSFLIQGPDDEPIDPEELFYSYDDWIQKNYEEDALSFEYDG